MRYNVVTDSYVEKEPETKTDAVLAVIQVDYEHSKFRPGDSSPENKERGVRLKNSISPLLRIATLWHLEDEGRKVADKVLATPHLV